MHIYRISANQANISFKKTIKAFSYQDAKNKFYNEINKSNISFPYIYPEVEIVNINRRY